MPSKKRKSTNPFDSDSPDGTSSGVFHDRRQTSEVPAERNNAGRRSQNEQLDFNFHHGDEKQNLQFDNKHHNPYPAVSPLEQALKQNADSKHDFSNDSVELDSSIESLEDDFAITEESPLISTNDIPDFIQAERSQHRRTNDLGRSSHKTNLTVDTRQSKNGTKKTSKKENSVSKLAESSRRHKDPLSASPVLMELSSTQQDQDLSKDYKMIRLEDLGTASSWLVLLLPYFAFALCLLLESDSSFQVSEWGPVSGSYFCFDDERSSGTTVPILPTPPGPCIYQFDALTSWRGSLFEIEQEISNYVKKNKNATGETDISRGIAFESGVITTVPPSATVFYADATFAGLTTEDVAFIDRGSVSVTGLLFQRQNDLDMSKRNEEQWDLMATSRPETLSMACHLEGETAKSVPSWICNSPRIMEVLFSIPGSPILSAGDLRINILFSNQASPERHDKGHRRSYVYTNEEVYSLLYSVENDNTAPEDMLSRIVQTSQYTIIHTNPTAKMIDIGGRLVALSVTLVFTWFWLGRLGFWDCCALSYCQFCKARDELFKVRRAMSLLDSPWVVFPERWYILFLLVSLMLVEGPLLIVVYLNPSRNSNAKIHTAADTMVGIGVNGVLFVYLCLFEGLKYHSANVSRKWMEHHRHLTEVRRTAKYVVGDSPKEASGSDSDAIVQYMAEYFERQGNTNGISSSVSLRLHHDPFSDYWADFLFPKLLVFALGVVSIWLTAFTRFHFSDSDVTTERLRTANLVYLTSYAVQFSVLIIWLVLILRSSMETGRRLRMEPFLSTRPAQLAYRIIFVHMMLGLLILVTLIFLGLGNLLRKWEGADLRDGNEAFRAGVDQDPQSSLDFWMELLARIIQRFPYSGTATSIGLGRICFATISVLITAFIFLPPWSETFNTEEDQQVASRNEKSRERRDKRVVVSMLKYAHAWRVFPLPIKQVSAMKRIMLSEDFFQLYTDGSRDRNLQGRGLISIGTYTPIFCTELACWLLEASFQAYYSPNAVEWNDMTPGKMKLASIGLRLEAAILDETTNTQAFVATNVADQVDGVADSIIVISFRGSVDTSNLITDLKSRMVPLHDQLIGIDNAPFKVTKNEFFVEDKDGWTWNNAIDCSETHTVSCFSPRNTLVESGCLSFPASAPEKRHPTSAVTSGAMAVLSATPVARDTLPCVHEGFQEVYAVVRKKVIESVLPVIQRQMSKACTTRDTPGIEPEKEPLALPKLYITGHSLGGSLAQLLALDLANNCELTIDVNPESTGGTPENEIFRLPTPASTSAKGFSDSESSPLRRYPTSERLSLTPPIACYTFGEPRVGNRAFSRLYKQKVPHTFRVATEGDPITAMPHVVCSGIYKHAGLEVVLDEGKTGNILVGPTVVETLFRFHKVRTDFAAHSTDRYRDCLESALEQHELQEYYKGHHQSDAEAGYGSIQTTHYTQDVPDWLMVQGRPSPFHQ